MKVCSITSGEPSRIPSINKWYPFHIPYGNKPNYALKHTYQLRGMASILRMRTTISARQWQPWTAVSPFLGLISVA